MWTMIAAAMMLPRSFVGASYQVESSYWSSSQPFIPTFHSDVYSKCELLTEVSCNFCLKNLPSEDVCALMDGAAQSARPPLLPKILS